MVRRDDTRDSAIEILFDQTSRGICLSRRGVSNQRSRKVESATTRHQKLVRFPSETMTQKRFASSRRLLAVKCAATTKAMLAWLSVGILENRVDGF